MSKPTPQTAAERTRRAYDDLMRALEAQIKTTSRRYGPHRYDALDNALRAVEHAAVWCDATPEQHLLVAKACCKYTPQHARTLQAAQRIGAVDNETLYSVPSESKPGTFRTVKLHASGAAHCDCPASGECFHIRSARRVADLQAAPPLSQVVPVAEIHNNTTAANDRAEQGVGRYARYFPKAMVTA